MPVLTRARDSEQARPSSRECLDGRVLTCAGYGDTARWREGERLEQVFESRCDRLRQEGHADHLAVDAGDVTLTYADVDALANQLARFLVRRGVRPGDRVGLLFDEAVDSYTGMLAVLKAHAAYVPLDAAFPADRLAFIAADAGLQLVLTRSRLAGCLDSLADGTGLVSVDQARELIAAEPTGRLVPGEVGEADDDLCYVIYTSGTTGRPKGVAITHASICNFVNVAAAVYGPTEATVTATWTLLHPDRPVTIGVPLPTYSVLILDPDTGRALPPGQMGEIGIAGIGLARGYLNRPDLTERAFIPDFLGIPGNPDGRIYRTGDLGRISPDGEVEHHGRIDTQVKVRGYRVELTEIESVLLTVPGIAQAAVNACHPEPGVTELAAYYSLRRGTPAPDPDHIYAHLGGRLPAYMVPAYLEQLPTLPALPSGKTDRNSLPAPRGQRRLAGRGEYVAPADGTEQELAGLLADVLRVDQVSADSHFFADLGADSLLMARFTAAIRARGGLSAVSMKDIYLHPTIRQLAAALAGAGPASAPGTAPGPAEALAGPAEHEATATGTSRYLLCGVLQLLVFAAYACLASAWLNIRLGWVTAGPGILTVYARAAVVGGGGLLAMGMLPVAAKWVLIGRWKRQRIRVWSLSYVPFWVVKTLLAANPMARLCVGTPLYGLYLRALGAKVGRGAVIFTSHLPVCTDLLIIGPGAVIRKDCYLSGYRARSGVIETGAVTVGAGAFVGEQTVLDIGTVLGDGAQLGHASALHAGQEVPAGQIWHGAPAQPAGDGCNYQAVPPARCGTLRRAATSIGRLLMALAVIGPLEAAAAALLLYRPEVLTHLLSGAAPVVGWADVQDAAGISAVAFAGFILAGLLFVTTVPRLLAAALQPAKAYPLYGVHYGLQRAVSRLTNVTFFNLLFGDSSAVVYYLRALGYKLAPAEQTGSNFGMEVKHEVPTLAIVGTGTMVSDGLSVMNAEFSATSFRVMPAAIGKRNFLGNGIAYPASGRTGDDCLIATKAMVPFGLALTALLTAGSDGQSDILSTAVMITVGVPFTIGYWVLVDRAVTRFRRLRPQYCSVYQRAFWRHERFWKVPATAYIHMFNGTPYKNLLWRLLGVRIGRRVFDDGCHIVERSMVSVGSGCTLNAATTVQGHSLEDGTFKSGPITIGSGCTLGTGAFVHYDVTMGDGAILDTDSFAMKGEHIPPHAWWLGNPAAAHPTRTTTVADPACGHMIMA
jgi:acyl-CoA synthetase (AMP-forming)/AMP-acid ligase II/acetyltransferase-like isoleucine patch superfamily enzyme/acyl carrier protein